LRAKLDRLAPLVQQVMRQARARVFAGDTHAEGKIVSMFEPATEIIRKGKTGKPTEFGKMVRLQEAENQRPKSSSNTGSTQECIDRRSRRPYCVCAYRSSYLTEGAARRLAVPPAAT
jgi:hypothetical protein